MLSIPVVTANLSSGSREIAIMYGHLVVRHECNMGRVAQ